MEDTVKEESGSNLGPVVVRRQLEHERLPRVDGVQGLAGLVSDVHGQHVDSVSWREDLISFWTHGRVKEGTNGMETNRERCRRTS